MGLQGGTGPECVEEGVELQAERSDQQVETESSPGQSYRVSEQQTEPCIFEGLPATTSNAKRAVLMTEAIFI